MHNWKNFTMEAPNQLREVRRTSDGQNVVGMNVNIEAHSTNSKTSSMHWLSKDIELGVSETDGEEHVVLELTLDVHSDSVTLRSIMQSSSSPETAVVIEDQGRRETRNRSHHHLEHFFQDRLRLSRGSSGSRVRPRVVPISFSPEREQCNNLVSAPLPNQPILSKSVSRTEHALEGLRFISKATDDKDPEALWREVDARFQKLATSDGSLRRSDFADCIGMKDSKEFALEILDALARRRDLEKQQSTSISKDDLYQYWMQITDRSFHSRTQIFFDLCDKDADGRIAEDEVKEIILLSASANKLSMMREQAEEYAALIMEELDRDNHGYIELSQLEALFRGGFGKATSQNHSQILIPSQGRCLLEVLARKSKFYLLNHWQRLWIIFLWLAVMAGLFTWKFLQYKRRPAFEVMGYCVCTAKGAAETLKLNMALILLPVCRNTITWFRSTFLGNFIPFDDNMNFHKVIAGAIVIGVILHGGTHLACDFPRIARADVPLFHDTMAIDFGGQRPSFMELLMTAEVLAGILMVFLMSVAFLLAIPLFRKNGIKLPWPLNRLTGFNAFWYSHHLFILVYGLLMFHSLDLFLAHQWTEKTTWLYISVPLLLYCGERTLRSFRSSQLHKVDLIKPALYREDVLALYMTKPPGFKYQSGMYIFLKCPNVSPFEWHPFTLTSAPGDDYLSVHVRSCGDWTQELMRVFNQALIQEDPEKHSINRFPRLLVDGPYGAPAQDYKKYDVMLLVGLGIGATPFISILKDILNELKTADDQPGTQSNHPKAGKMSGQKNAYFYWVTREQSSFEWFKEVMNEVAEIDQKATIEMHNHLTSVYEEGDARSALLTMVQALHHARNGVDIVSGTRVRTHFARPNWRKVFARLAARHPGATIGVFYCGPACLTKELDALSKKFTRNSRTKFEFHKENF